MKSKILGMGLGLAVATLGVVAVPAGLAFADSTTATTTATCYTGCSAPQQQVTPPVTEPSVPVVTTPPVAAPTQASLPFTGADIEGMAAIGAGALVLGGVLVRRSRRHGHAAA